METSEKKTIKPCECGGTKFVTTETIHQVYKFIDGELRYDNSYLDNEYGDPIKISCSDCGKEIEDATSDLLP